MGGRGAASAGTSVLPAEILENLPDNIISYDDKLGGAVYPFLEQTKRAWRILTWPVDALSEPHLAHTFGLDSPTLRWVKGSQVSDLYVDGMTTEQFLAATSIAFHKSLTGLSL